MGKRSLLVAASLLAAAGAVAWWRVNAVPPAGSLIAAAPAAPLDDERAPAATLRPPPALASEDAGAARSVVEPSAPAARAESAGEAGAGEGTLLVHVFRTDTREPFPGERLVVLQDGAPWSSTSVAGSTGGLSEAVQTDERGRCRFHVPAGVRARLISTGNGAIPDAELAVEPLAAGETREVELPIPVFLHWIRVESAHDGAALAGAVLSDEQDERSVRTAADGYAKLWCVEGEASVVTAEAEGHGPALLTLRRGHETPEKAFVLRLSRGACLKGRVLGAGDEPISGASVSVLAWTGALARNDPFAFEEAWKGIMSLEDRTWSTHADGSGAFALCDLPLAIPLRVSVAGGGLELTFVNPLRLEAGEQRDVVYRLGSGATVLGAVRDASGAGVPACELVLAPAHEVGLDEEALLERRVSSDAEGRFELRDVSPGDWKLGPVPGSGYAIAPLLVNVPEAVDSVEVVVVVEPALFIAGRVVDLDGRGVSGAHVFSFSGSSHQSDQSDGDGAFQVGPFARGPVQLNVMALGTGYVAEEDLRVEAGRQDVVLRVQPGGCLAGRMVDAATGEPVPGSITVTGTEDWVHMSTVDRSGAFEVCGLKPRAYCLLARAAGGRTGVIEHVEVPVAGGGQNELVVRVAPGGQLALRFPSSESARYRVLRGDCVLVHDSVGPEEKLTPHLPAGAVTVELLSNSGSPISSREVVVAAGTTLVVDLTR